MSIQNLIKEGTDLFKNKKFDEAITKLSQASGKIENKDSQIQERNDIQFWLGRCYFEQAMKTKGEASTRLFEQAIEHHQQQLRLAEQLEGENGIQEQIYAQHWLGRCYFEQAMKAEGEASEQLFGQAVKHHQQQLRLAKQLEDENGIQEQINAQHWLGRCYLEQAMRAEEEASEHLFGLAIKRHQQQLRLAKQLEDKQNSIQKQINAQSWLGRCYFEQAMKAERKASEKLFGQAVEHNQERLRFAKQLKGKNGIQKQIYAQHWLGRCYLEQAMKAKGKDVERLSGQAVEHYQSQLRLIEELTDEQGRLRQQNYAQSWLGYCYFRLAIKAEKEAAAELSEQDNKSFQKQPEFSKHLPPLTQEEWERYFEWKKQGIQNKLFKDNKENLTSAISTILAVLNIPPIELDSTPLAHYTSPSVCEKLFGIVHDKNDANNKDNEPVDKQQASPMRISSSTYMNDPTEGEGLLDLLNLQDLELENKADCPKYNAFFACFSSRVNDLNQFRLYGKENGVEASGCCLVFNKDGNWLRDPDVSFSFRSMAEKGDEYSREQPIEADISDADLKYISLPLYQVAYVAYRDEYLAKDKCSIWLSNRNKQKFGIQLKPVGENPEWHQLRTRKLKEALIELMDKSNNISDEDREALEYIRYLFKDFAFRDEEEFRLLKIEQIGSDQIEYCETTQSIYLPYADACDIVNEVILGTNYEKSGEGRKAEAFQHLMRKYYPNIKVSRSLLPINANPPIKKD